MLASFQNTTRYLLLAVITMGVTACGFQLRGDQNIPAQLKTITLTSDAKSSTFDTALRIALTHADITVVPADKAGDDTLNLKINQVRESNVVLAVDSDDADTTHVERRYSVDYFIRQADGKSLYGPRSLMVNKLLGQQDAETSTKSAVNTASENEMLDELAQKIVSDLYYAPLESIRQ